MTRLANEIQEGILWIQVEQHITKLDHQDDEAISIEVHSFNRLVKDRKRALIKSFGMLIGDG